MEINRAYGPRPPTPSTGAAANLSAAKAALLKRLLGQPEPTTIAALVTASGLHQNTVREHLDSLVSLGLARRVAGVARGRGRPAWRYQAVEPRETEPAAAEYAGLASVLADHIARTSTDPRADAISAGANWGRELVGQSQPADTSLEARREVVALLDNLRFAPESDPEVSTVRLRRCPLLAAAHRHPDIVCGVHLGIVRGALAELGGDPDRADLIPFAEPGACRLELQTATSGNG